MFWAWFWFIVKSKVLIPVTEYNQNTIVAVTEYTVDEYRMKQC